MKNPRFVILVAMVVLAAISRVVPHPWNVTPVAAMALFSGAHFTDKRAAFFVPLVALLMSDIVLGFYSTMPVVYACFALTVLIGRQLRDNKTVALVGGASIASSLMFFVVTNFACWLTMPVYTKDLFGFTSCYAQALPFFRNTVAGDLIFTAVLFGGFALSQKVFPSLRQTTATAGKLA